MNDEFRSLLASRGLPWLEVRGGEHDRLRQALAAVDELLAEGWQLADPAG
jgi:HTH-type transcriptional repressor of NAD biosynthesis genes